MNRPTEGALKAELKQSSSQKVSAAAEVLQRTRPDVVLLNEFDFDAESLGIQRFQNHYLAVSQNGQSPIRYPFVFTAPVNTGVPSGMDLDNNGKTDDPTDSFGYGKFPGQYGMVVLSMFPIESANVRTFRNTLWKDLPKSKQPIDPSTGESFYTATEWDRFRLSSKSHWDVPIQVASHTIHFLVCHPTPPAFDGPERRNQLRNHDEIKFWADYIHPELNAAVRDDAGRAGGLAANARFIIAGDLNADPIDGSSENHAILQLLDHPLVQPTNPSSRGAAVAAKTQGKANLKHKSDAKFDTGDFSDRSTGNLRVDYVLPSKFGLKVAGSSVFWPESTDGMRLVATASDHRLVWLDVSID